MSIDNSWDVEKYKSPFESEEHWELRKAFLLAHKDKYPEQKLICLAQVFFNVEFLGCKYPDETMNLVEELSEGIADAFREKKQNKIQRTFVKASDAAGAKIKGLSRVTSTLPPVQFTKETPISDSQPPAIQSSASELALFSLPIADSDSQDIVYSSHVQNLQNITLKSMPLRNVVIFRDTNESVSTHGLTILQRTFSKYKVNPEFDYQKRGTKGAEKWECSLLMEGTLLANALASSKQMSRRACLEVFFNSLQKLCYTIEQKVKILSDGSTVDKSLQQASEPQKIAENSIGSKMMKLMGWKGSGLGKTEQGISEPVAVQEHVHRTGFGANVSEKALIKQLNDKLRNYAETDTEFDLVFSSDFTKEERAKLHTLAQKYHLKTRSYGSGANRYLVVSKKVENQGSIIDSLKACGGENERYRLIAPSNVI